MTRNGVFFTNLEVFHLVIKHCVECLRLLLKQNELLMSFRNNRADCLERPRHLNMCSGD